MKKNLHKQPEDDFDYLAREGYRMVPSAGRDIAELSYRVKRRFSGNGGAVVISLIVLALTVSSVFVVAPRSDNNGHHATRISAKNSFEAVEKANTNDNGILPADSFSDVNLPGGKAGNTVVSKHAELRPVPREELFIRLERQGDSMKLPPPGEDRILFAPNAPVRFIAGCKVTSWYQLYFRHGKRVLPGGKEAADGDADNSGYAPVVPGEKLHEILEKALISYGKGEYRECLYGLHRISAYNENDLNCIFYSGMCHYYLNRCRPAIQQFDKCIGNRDNTFAQEALFYKAMALDECGETMEAQRLYSRIAEYGGFYAERARENLREN